MFPVSGSQRSQNRIFQHTSSLISGSFLKGNLRDSPDPREGLANIFKNFMRLSLDAGKVLANSCPLFYLIFLLHDT